MIRFSKMLAIAGFMFAAGQAAYAAPSYPMVCRGGAGTLGYHSQQQVALFYFAKAPGSAGRGLQPGQCAWTDRAIGAREPTCLRQPGIQTTAWIFPGQQRANSYFAPINNAPWLRSMLEPSTYQTFQATNPGDGNCFTITRLGP